MMKITKMMITNKAADKNYFNDSENDDNRDDDNDNHNGDKKITTSRTIF